MKASYTKYFAELMAFKKPEDLPCLLFFFSFGIFLFTATPSIYWRDSPEFQAIGFLLDIAHPSGSPLYSIVAKLFTLLPIANIGFKITILSSFFGACLCVLLYFISKSILTELLPKDSDEAPFLSVSVISLITALTFAFSNALWKNANLPEVYSFQNFFTATFLLIFLKWPPSSDENCDLLRPLLTFSFLFGLSLGAHSVIVLYLPFFLLYIHFAYYSSQVKPRVKTYALLAFAFLTGFSIYLYLPIRSSQDPYYDWGNPETFLSLMAHVSDRKDAAYHFMFSLDKLVSQLKLYSGFFIKSFSFVGVILGFIGLTYLVLKRKGTLLTLFALLFFPPFLFFIRYWWEESAFLPNFLIFSICIGLGLWVLQNLLRSVVIRHPGRRLYPLLVWGPLGIQFLMLFGNHYKANNKALYWEPKTILRSILDGVPPNAVVFSSRSAFGFNYLQQAEGYRPDISFLSVASFLSPELFMQVDQKKFPNIILPKVEPGRLGAAFLKRNVKQNPIYWEPDRNKNALVKKYLSPEAFLFRVNEKPTQLERTSIRRYLSALSRQVDFDRDIQDMEERRYYAMVIGGQGYFFLERGAIEIAQSHFEMALELFPNDTYFLNVLAVTHASLNEYEQAESVFLKAIQSNPLNSEPVLNLAKMYDYTGKKEEAESFFKRVLDLFPEHLEALKSLAEINIEKGDTMSARTYLEKATEVSPDDEEIKVKLEKLLSTFSKG